MIQLGKKKIERAGSKVYIIAEIGQNHQGSMDIAKEMIRIAKKSGCDCVKFQKSCLLAKFTTSALNNVYHSAHTWGKTYGEHKQYLEFTEEQYQELQCYCNTLEIDFTASAMDVISLEFLDALNVPFIKIGSGDANNFPLLEKAAMLARPLVISTGMQTMETVDRIVEIMRNKSDYALLHCVSSYPTAPEDSNLKMITLFRKRYPRVVIGYSGHETAQSLTQAAVLLGARIIERHFTLDKAQKGSDHKCSLEPQELKQLVSEIRTLNQSGILERAPLDRRDILNFLGNNACLNLALAEVTEKIILSCELSCRRKLGKSIVASRSLPKGHLLQPRDVCIKVSQPNGIPAEHFSAILGVALKCSIETDEPFTRTHININL